MMMKSVAISSPFRCRKSLRRSLKQSSNKENLKQTNSRRKSEDLGQNKPVKFDTQINDKLISQKSSFSQTVSCKDRQTVECKSQIMPKNTSKFPAPLRPFWPRDGWLEMEDEEDYHVYEDIDLPPTPPPKPKFQPAKQQPAARLNCQRSCSDSELFCVSTMSECYEIEVTNCQQKNNAALRPNPEQGFYRCHDNIADIHDKDLIPDLAPKLLREKQILLRDVSTDLTAPKSTDNQSVCRRRLSLDSGWEESEIGDEDLLPNRLETSISTASLPSLASVSSGIGSLQSSYSTLQQQQQQYEKGLKNKTENKSFVPTNSLKERPTFSQLDVKLISQQVFSDFEGVRKLPPHPKEDFQQLRKGENGFSAIAISKSPSPPPLPPRNTLSQKATLDVCPNKPITLPPKRPLPITRHKSQEVAASVNALQDLSKDLLNLIQVQKSSSVKKVTPPPDTVRAPRPRLPSPTVVSSSESDSSHDDSTLNTTTRSATLPCKRTLNFSDSSIVADQNNVKNENINNNTILSIDTPVAGDVISESEERSVRRSESSHRRRCSSLFKNPLQRRKSDLTSRGGRNTRRINDVTSPGKTSGGFVRKASDVTSPIRSSRASIRRPNEVIISPTQISKSTKRRRTLFNLASPFSNKNKASQQERTKSEKDDDLKMLNNSLDEETLPLTINDREKQDVEEAIREGLPVIPFFQTPRLDAASTRSTQNSLSAQSSMTVRALATPFTSRRLPQGYFIEHPLLFPPYQTKGFLLDDCRLNLPLLCSSRHCKSCTCNSSPKPFEDNDDYVKMDSITPSI